MTVFVKGDVVRLKSGSPSMTVEDESPAVVGMMVGSTDHVGVVWGTADQIYRAVISAECLERVSLDELRAANQALPKPPFLAYIDWVL